MFYRGTKTPALLYKIKEGDSMRLHDHYWFSTYGKNTNHSPEEVELIWQSLSTSQIDYFQELCEYFYAEGVKAGRDETC